MGLSSVLVYAAGFIVLVFLFIGGTTMYVQQAEKAKETIQGMKEMNLEDLEILNASYDRNTTTIWASNKGQKAIKTSQVDVYIDGRFIARNSTNRSITVVEARNPGLWDPGEKAKIEIKEHLAAGTHRVKISPAKRSNQNAEASFVSGITTNETLAVISGQWEPPTGKAFSSAELLAVNNPGGTNITLNDTNKTAMLRMDSTAHQPAQILSSFVLVDYKAEGINDNEFGIEAREGSYNGQLLCNKSVGSSTAISTVSINCSSISSSNIGNIYIMLNNTASAGKNITVDYARLNVTYIYEN